MPRTERPLAGGDGPIVRFAADLRKLREHAGNPVYRELSRRAHYSPAALSEAAAGRRLPSLSVTLAYVSACSGDTAEWERRWREVTAALCAPAEQAEPTGAPYVGLAPFDTVDSHLFFGREPLVAELVDRMNGRRFVGLFGPSGSGKSSILRAGLAAGRANRPTILFTPGARPVEECAVQLASFLDESPAALRAEFTADPANLGLRVRQALADRGDEADLLLVVDQFEEVFTRCADPAERDAFIAALLAAATGRTRVAIGVRADFQADCLRHPELAAALQDAQVVVGAMTIDELRQAIIQPAVSAGCIVSTTLVARLISDVAGEVAALPLLSHALLETWRRRQGTTLTVAGYEAVGGIHHTLARIADQTYTGLTEDRQRIARRLFLRLIALGDGAEDAKRRVPRRELDADDATKSVLDTLVDARLLTVAADGVEIAHESLIRHWPRLRDWLAEDREGLRIQRALTRATDDWEALDRDPGALYQGLRLASAGEWAARAGDAVTARERAFLDASRSACRRHSLRFRQVVALLAVLLVVAVSALSYAVYMEQSAARQRDAALSERLLGLASLRVTDPALALQLAVVAYRVDPSSAARDSVLSGLSTPYAAKVSVGIGAALSTALGRRLMVASGEDGTVALFDVANPHHPVQLTTLPDLRGPVSAVAINPAGTLVAAGGADGVVRLWDVSDPYRPRSRAELAGHAANVASVAFGPDGHLLASGGNDGTARLWDVDAGSQLAMIPGGPVVAFDGHRLATVSDNTIRLFNLANSHDLSPGPTFPGHTVAFGPNGILATAGDDGTIRLWDAKGAPLAVLSGHTKTVTSLAFASDGHTVASGGADKTVRLWSIDGTPLAVLSGHTNAVLSVAFGPDGHTLATASADKSVRVDDLTPVLTAAPVTAIAVSGTRAVTGGRDGVARLLDVSDPHRPRVIREFPGGGDAITAVAFDGRHLSTVDKRGEVRAWDVEHPGDPTIDHTGLVDRVALSADGGTLATPDPDGSVRVWRGGASTKLPSEGTAVTAVAVSRDGRLLACADTAQKIRIWNLADFAHPSLLATLVGHTDTVNALSFAPDGRGLVSGGADGTVLIWDLHRQTAVLTGHTDAVTAVSFSPNGLTLASAAADGTVRLWDANGTSLAVFTGHTDTVNAIAFAPDGRTVLSGGDDTLRLWDTDVERAIDHVCSVAWPRLSPGDWQRYLPGLDYQPPCL